MPATTPATVRDPDTVEVREPDSVEVLDEEPDIPQAPIQGHVVIQGVVLPARDDVVSPKLAERSWFTQKRNSKRGGRPKELEARLRYYLSQVSDNDPRDHLERVFAFLMDVVLGRGVHGETAKTRDRLIAVQMLLDRAYGKPRQTVESTSTVRTASTKVDMSKLSAADLDALETTLAKALPEDDEIDDE